MRRSFPLRLGAGLSLISEMAIARLALCGIVVMGCTRSENRVADGRAATDTAAAPPATPVASATISLADVAGKWQLRTTDEAGGKAVETELVATADTTGWTLTGPNRKPIPVRVIAVAGDSIVTEAGPYESFIRKGVQVTTRSVSRLQGGKLVGTLEARYALKGGDSIAQRRSEGTRVR